MFDLEKEVQTWSEAVHAERCHPAGSVAELADHLHCEIDRLRATPSGNPLSDEQAFRAAVARLGATPALAAENAKNRSLLETGCAVARDERAPSVTGRAGTHRRLLLAHAVLWASLMIGASLLMSKTSMATAFSLLLILALGPAWWASDRIVRRALRTKPAVGA